MSAEAASSPPPPPRIISPKRTLQRLFLTLFLRGRSARGLRKASAPRSVMSKLWLMLLIYAGVGAVGAMSLILTKQPVFGFSLYLHTMTLVFLGMFVAASSGEVLFNKEEADILLHRPVTPGMLLWAKIGVLVQVSLWLAGAFNLVGLFAGIAAQGSSWSYPIAHAVSTVLEALFCTGSVVVIYQLCLRWFGRERLDNLMTLAQVFVAVAAVLMGQVPRLLFSLSGKLTLNTGSWWVALLPPAWFAGFDDTLAGAAGAGSGTLAVVGMAATATVLWLAFGKLAHDYGAGLQTLGETRAAKKPKAGRRRFLDVLVNAPPLRWWLRDSVARASFLLTTAYLVRDRDVKLRVYPGVMPMLIFPLIMLMPSHGASAGPMGGGFAIAFAGVYLGIIPCVALNLLRYSQQWQAADLFRVAPMAGPAALCHGARQAVLCFLGFPLVGLVALAAWFIGHGTAQLPLLLPGIIALPVYALVPCLGGDAVPLSMPTEEAKSAGRGVLMIGVMALSDILAGVAIWAWTQGWFNWLLLIESIVVIITYWWMRSAIASARWTSLE